MDFYHALSEYYDEIFPLKGPQKTFLQDYLRQESVSSVLDIGCGTGTFALEMSQTGVQVLGVDLSDEMIEISKIKAQKTASSASFSVADMRDLSSINERFDGIVCLGNTLAHVSGEIELKQVLAQFREKGDRLLLQIVNYDRILAQQIKELPFIKTEHLFFYRLYTHRADGKLDFAMKIEFPATRQVVSGVNILFPITCDILKNALMDTGWEVSKLWGNFERKPWTVDSPATILSAKRIPLTYLK
ncbi:class I SAM-dependent methyltransferase [Desulfosporosinus sp. Sb-LF]|uniref:class I SAM-dependent methyltransferase n=1 Tax=Desulfosporosinus sp. Sb-LF TaxID=2560027 RepID=UPI00107F22C5|nr:class I SAM-dependent methyltransferase [Desulfosporosinus sp. Sb-LF]TGE32406.1 class I SAM-dependent methyltransferase [Desulfosporosinus sp. Sb-LF]